MSGFVQLLDGLLVFEALVILDSNFFTVWEKDLFKNFAHLNETQRRTANHNNWNIIHKALTNFLEKENFQDSYFELSIEQILENDPGEFFGYFIAFISIMLIKKRYIWSQSLGSVNDSDSYNYLRNLETSLTGAEVETPETQKENRQDEEIDEKSKLVDLVSTLQRQLKDIEEKFGYSQVELEAKKEENEEMKKLMDLKVFENEKNKLRLQTLEQSQAEFYEAVKIKEENSSLLKKLKAVENSEEKLELENSLLREKLVSLEKTILELKTIESKYQVDDGLRKKYDMVCERNEHLTSDIRKKELEIEGLKYQVEILKKSKEINEATISAMNLEKVKTEQAMMSLHDEIKMKDQQNLSLDRIIIKLKEQLEVNIMTANTMTASGSSPTTPVRGKYSAENLDSYFKKPPEEEDRLSQLESELQKLKAEKELGWMDQESQMKIKLEKELLTQELTQLKEKVKRLTKELDSFRKKEEEWVLKEGKLNSTCKLLKKTNTEINKELTNIKAAKDSTKTLEALFSSPKEAKKQHQDEINMLYSLLVETQLKYNGLLQEKLSSKNSKLSFLETSSSMFESFSSF